MAEEQQPIEGVPEKAMKIADLVTAYRATKQQVADAQEELDAAKARHDEVAERLLPAALDELGMSEVVLTDGSVVSVSPKVSATWPSEANLQRRAAAIAWLESIGAADLVSCEVVAAFSRASLDAARELAKDLCERDDARVRLIEKVHPQTLSAFVRDRLENGLPVDTDAINVFVSRRATVKEG